MGDCVFDHGTAFHHERYILQDTDIDKRIAIDGDQLGEPAWFDSADAILPTHQVGDGSGTRPQEAADLVLSQQRFRLRFCRVSLDLQDEAVRDFAHSPRAMAIFSRACCKVSSRYLRIRGYENQWKCSGLALYARLV